MAGWWFSPGTLVSSTNKIDRHDITENIVEKGVKHHNPPPKPNVTLYLKNTKPTLG